MGEIVLVRHGQANSKATNEEDYDRLSALGHQQAEWLGAWMHAHEPSFDVVFSGTMRRHIQTATSMGYAPQHRDPRLNEMNYHALVDEMHAIKGVPGPANQEEFIDHFMATLAAWHEEEIAGAEPFARFEARVADIMAEAAAPGRRVLCLTSGGVIGMAIRTALGLDIERTAKILLPIYNSSVHRFHVSDRGIVLAGFNALPHLDTPARREARTQL
ncbi:MAG: histidine phosphatase family protein [Pseudomonadota bacterium]